MPISAFKTYTLQLKIPDGAASMWSPSCILHEGHRASVYKQSKSFRIAFTAWTEHTYMVNIKSRSVLIDFKPQNGFFIDNRGKIICEMCQYLLVSCATMLTYQSIPWYILGWQLWEIHVQQNPHARGLHPFRSTSDLKQIYSTWNQFTED